MKVIQISEGTSWVLSWVIVIVAAWVLLEIVVRLVIRVQDSRGRKRRSRKAKRLRRERLDELNKLLDDKGSRVDAFFAGAPGSDNDDLEEVVAQARLEAAIRYDPSLAEFLYAPTGKGKS